jgi:conjugal transfer ATP-binding protein TraC
LILSRYASNWNIGRPQVEAVKAARMMLKRQPLSELLPYLAYSQDHDVYVLDTGIGFIFECSPLPYAADDTMLTLKGLFESNFPSGTSLQIMLYASKRVRPILDAYIALRENATGDSIHTDLAKKKAEYLEGGADRSILKGYESRLRDFRLIISVVVPCGKTPDSYESSIRNMTGVKETVKQILHTGHLNPHGVPPDRFISLMSELMNPGHDFYGAGHYDPQIPIKNQVLYSDTEIRIEKDYIETDGKILRSMTVRQYPETWDLSRGIDYCGSIFENVKQINTPFFIVFSAEYPDTVKTISSIQRKAMTVGHQAFGPLAKWFPKIVMKKHHFDNFVLSLEGGSNPFYGSMSIFFYADDLKHAYDIEGECASLFRSMNFILQRDTFIMLPLFLQSLPMGYLSNAQKDLRRRKILTSENVAALLPLIADWKGLGDPVLLFISRRGQLQHLDIFANPMGGFSGVVVASTGAGKSFFVNEFAEAYLGVGAKLWIIDVGRSYEKLCSLLDGDFLVFGSNSSSCINPFSRIVDIDDEMPILKSIVAQMISRETLNELALSFIEEAIKECHVRCRNERRAMTVTHIAEYLKDLDDPRCHDLAKRLYPYTAAGAYAAFFEGESNFSPQKNFIVLELEELKAKKDLQEVVLLTLIYQIQQEVMRDRLQKKIVIIDEAFDLLTGQNTSVFMEESYRRFRKYRGACLAVTQSINDFHRIPAGVAMLENADFQFLLRQKAESIEAMKNTKRVSLSDGHYELLKSVHTNVGSYSEIFIDSPVGKTIGRLVVDRFRQLLYTSKAEEFTQIKKYTDQGMSVSEAINKVIEEEQNLTTSK